MARSSFFISCSMLVLPLLVLFCPVPSSSTCNRFELDKDVKALGRRVKNCSEGCPGLVTFPPQDTCDCFNISVPTTNGSAFNYSIEALKSMRSMRSMHSAIHTDLKYLIARLEDCSGLNISVTMDYEPVISPVRLYNKLEYLSQQVNSQ